MKVPAMGLVHVAARFQFDLLPFLVYKGGREDFKRADLEVNLLYGLKERSRWKPGIYISRS